MPKSQTIVFWRRRVVDGEVTEEKVAWLEPSGKYTGDETLKKDIDRFIDEYKLDLTNSIDRDQLMSIFNGMYIFTTYAGDE